MGKEISSYEVRTPVVKLVGDGSRKHGLKLRNTGGMIVEFIMFIENKESTVKRAGNREGETICFQKNQHTFPTILGEPVFCLPFIAIMLIL